MRFTLQIKGIDIEEERIQKIKEKIKELREQHTYGESGDFLFDRPYRHPTECS